MPSPPPTSITVAASVSSPSLDLISALEACRGAPKEGRIGSPWQTTCSALKPRLRAWAATSLVATKHLSTSYENKWNIVHKNQSNFTLWNQVEWHLVRSVTTVAKGTSTKRDPLIRRIMFSWAQSVRHSRRRNSVMVRTGTCCINGCTLTIRCGSISMNACVKFRATMAAYP